MCRSEIVDAEEDESTCWKKGTGEIATVQFYCVYMLFFSCSARFFSPLSIV